MNSSRTDNWMSLGVYIVGALVVYLLAALLFQAAITEQLVHETVVRILTMIFFFAGIGMTLLTINLIGDIYTDKVSDRILDLQFEAEEDAGEAELEEEIEDQEAEELEIEAIAAEIAAYEPQ